MLTAPPKTKKYAGLSLTDRRNVLSILQATKPNLPAYLRDARI